MEAQKYIGFILVVLMYLMMVSEAHHFWVGVKDGWVLNPSEGYSHWSRRMRFNVNDTLVFKMKEGSDSVLVVEKNAYYNCTKANPLLNLTSAQSEFTFSHSGPFYFISGEADHCLKGQKLETVVIAVRHDHHNATSPSPLPAPTGRGSSALAPAPSHSAAPKPFVGLGVLFGCALIVFGL